MVWHAKRALALGTPRSCTQCMPLPASRWHGAYLLRSSACVRACVCVCDPYPDWLAFGSFKFFSHEWLWCTNKSLHHAQHEFCKSAALKHVEAHVQGHALSGFMQKGAAPPPSWTVSANAPSTAPPEQARGHGYGRPVHTQGALGFWALPGCSKATF